MVLFSAKRNMFKKTHSIILIFLFVFFASIAEAQTTEQRTNDIENVDSLPVSTTRQPLNSSNESMAETLGNSGCTALGGAIGNTLSSLGKQLLVSAGVQGVGATAGSIVNEALGGGSLGNTAGNTVSSAVDKVTNSVVSGAVNEINKSVNGTISGIGGAIVTGADNFLSSDFAKGATEKVGSALIDLGTSLNSDTLFNAGSELTSIASGQSTGSIANLFGGGGSAVPGVGSILSLIGGGGQVPTDPQTIVQQITTLQQDTSILKTKETCLNRLSYTSSLITRAKMEDNIRNWLNTGNNGNPLYVTNMTDYISKQTENQTKLFISDLSKSNSPYKNEAIKNIVSKEQTRNTNSTGVLNDSLPSIIGSTNAVKYRSGDFSAGGWKAWNALTQIESNNKFGHILATERLYQEGQDRAEEEAKEKLVNNVPPQEECIDIDESSGACRRYKIVTPASVIEEKLRSIATAPERNAGNIGADSNETISTADLALQNFLTDVNSSFWEITDNNATAREISSQENNSTNDVVGSIERTADSLIGYITIIDELHNVTSEAAELTNSLIKLGPVTYCPSNLANQSNSGVSSLFDRVALYNQAITSLTGEINSTARTMVELYALKDAVTLEGLDYKTAAGELINISTSGKIPSSTVVTNASSQLSQARTIRDTTSAMIIACEAEHKEILAEEERKKQNIPTTYY